MSEDISFTDLSIQPQLPQRAVLGSRARTGVSLGPVPSVAPGYEVVNEMPEVGKQAVARAHEIVANVGSVANAETVTFDLAAGLALRHMHARSHRRGARS